MKRGGQTLKGFYRKTGLRNQRYRRDSEYHLARRCPRRDIPRGDGGSLPHKCDRSQRPPRPSITLETPVLPQIAESVGESGAGSKCKQSSAATADAWGDSLAALETGAAAKLVSFSWLAHRNRILERYWTQG